MVMGRFSNQKKNILWCNVILMAVQMEEGIEVGNVTKLILNCTVCLLGRMDMDYDIKAKEWMSKHLVDHDQVVKIDHFCNKVTCMIESKSKVDFLGDSMNISDFKLDNTEMLCNRALEHIVMAFKWQTMGTSGICTDELSNNVFSISECIFHLVCTMHVILEVKGGNKVILDDAIVTKCFFNILSENLVTPSAFQILQT